MLNQKKLVSAIAIAIGTSAGAVGSVHADSALFPFLVNGPTVTSIVSVMNGGDGYMFGNAEFLHYTYYYKSVFADPKDPCKEKNVYRPTSPYDIQTIDLGGTYGSTTLGVLFNDPSFYNDWEGPGQTFALGADLDPHRAYLVVDNSQGVMSGEAFIFEVASGATWGYQAFKAGETANQADFTGFATVVPSQIPVMPFDDITTKLAVTPVFTPMAGIPSNNYQVEVSLKVTDQFNNTGVMFDRDEIPVSGSVPQRVTCIDAVEVRDLLSDGLADAGGELADGGWTEVYTEKPTSATAGVTPVESAIIYKVEYGAGTFNGEPANGVFNNGTWLPNVPKPVKP